MNAMEFIGETHRSPRPELLHFGTAQGEPNGIASIAIFLRRRSRGKLHTRGRRAARRAAVALAADSQTRSRARREAFQSLPTFPPPHPFRQTLFPHTRPHPPP